MNQHPPPPSEQELTSRNHRLGLIRHIVLFRYRPGLDQIELDRIKHRFHELQTSPRDGESYILGIESGDQISTEGLGQGFHHAFIVTFASEGDRNYYVGAPFITDPNFYDPMHHAFKTFLGPYLDTETGSALVFDFLVSSGPGHGVE